MDEESGGSEGVLEVSEGIKYAYSLPERSGQLEVNEEVCIVVLS